MTQLFLDFPLPRGSATVRDEKIIVDLGNGVTLTTEAPPWIKSVYTATLRVALTVEGCPPDAIVNGAPVS